MSFTLSKDKRLNEDVKLPDTISQEFTVELNDGVPTIVAKQEENTDKIILNTLITTTADGDLYIINPKGYRIKNFKLDHENQQIYFFKNLTNYTKTEKLQIIKIGEKEYRNIMQGNKIIFYIDYYGDGFTKVEYNLELNKLTMIDQQEGYK
ncbi:hypothetical protein [Paenibacillus swuensis]|uniref:hypothetical protein n=1 Tax=Paenibacillus swuensis TaxID=1178515 RepID=UPI0018D32042|nr:hypothetical protein [Paenibacillus swuensis]